MSSAEICLNPTIPNVIYCSNRGQLHLKDTAGAKGDAVAIVLLSEDGSKVEEIKHVETGCDALRGMQISKDGKFAAIGGQDGGGVEIYQIGGKRGDEWKLAAKDETLESIVSFIWL
jgi:6-phosphogluconolactonase (cycloisomerase 2 family)